MAPMTEMVPRPMVVSGEMAAPVTMLREMPPKARERAVMAVELLLFGMMAPGALVMARLVAAVAVVKRDLAARADADAGPIRGLGGRRHGERERAQRRADPSVS